MKMKTLEPVHWVEEIRKNMLFLLSRTECLNNTFVLLNYQYLVDLVVDRV